MKSGRLLWEPFFFQLSLRSMSRFCFISVLILVPLSFWAQNILIGTDHQPNEPSIIMDPRHPNYLVAGSNIRNYYYSQDTGRTWTAGLLNSSNGVWGDPAITVDTAGDFYFFHLSNPATGNWIDRIVCQKSEDHGINWNDGSYTGLNGTKAQDKHWPVVDPVNNMIYVSWTQFDEYGTSSPVDSSIILFSKSADAGISWSEPKRINKVAGDCIDSDGTVEGAVPAVGPNG
ncbi:MAG TPA: sialidase family protein, partial [Saprospiraceae bacterium]|nr:sialidase family protein [Saprospiraceae bacterium]